MGNAWSKFEELKRCPNGLDCGNPSNGISAGAGGAGIGINVVLSIFVILSQWGVADEACYEPLIENPVWRKLVHERKKRRWAMQQLILNFSDQQLITGLALAVSARFFTSCTQPISAYHYDLTCYLLLCSVVTHLCSIVATNHYFDPTTGSKHRQTNRWVFLIIRCLAMAVTVVLTGLILFERDRERFPVEPPASYDDSDKLLIRPAACFFVGADDLPTIGHDLPDTFKNWTDANWTHGLIQYVIFILAIAVAVPVAIFQSIYHAARGGKPAAKPVLLLRLVVVVVGFVILMWNLSLAWNLRAWIHRAGWLADAVGAEDSWNFSQILTLFIIFYAPLNLFDGFADKYDAQQHLEGIEPTLNVGIVAGAVAPGEAISGASHSGWPGGRHHR